MLKSLPSIAVTVDGQEFDPNENVWKLSSASGSINFNFNLLVPIVSPELLHHLKEFLVERIAKFSPAAGRMFFNFLTATLGRNDQRKDICQIELRDLLRARGTALEKIRPYIRQWHRLKIPGVSTEAYEWISKRKIKHQQHKAVLTSSPIHGPFEEDEVAMLLRLLNIRYGEGAIETDDYLLIIILLSFGPRPSQIALLRCTDLISSPEGRSRLRIPSVKRGTQHRSEFRERPLAPIHAELIQKQIELRSSPEENPNSEQTSLLRWVSADAIRERLRRLSLSALNITCPRTGKAMSLLPGRFRHTHATRAAEEGFGSLYIAELLDHTTDDTAKVYVQARGTLAEKITRATEKDLTPLSELFLGKIVEVPSESPRGDDPESLIRSPSTGNLGNCGCFGPCHALAPLSCYTCPAFYPWRHASHNQLLNALLAEKERILNVTQDLRIAAVNDLTIRAIKQVISLCDDHK